MHEKSSRLSGAYREKGNESFVKGDYFQASLFYNKSLAFAESSEDLGLVYANRSAVYLEIKEFEKCLQNIKWARENQYPEEKLEKLKEREEKCMKLKEADDREVVDSFFKLSYAKHPKIPLITENLYVKETEEFGRGVYAATDLKPGDVIANECPVFTILHENDDSRYKHCCCCMSSDMMNLIPCLKTAALMFCSEYCRSAIYSSFDTESLEDLIAASNPQHFNMTTIMAFFCQFFKSFDDFCAYIENFDSKNYTKTIFDFDFSNPEDENNKKNLLHCFFALKSKKFDHDRIMTEIAPISNFEEFLNYFGGILRYNLIIMRYQEQNTTIERSHGTAVFAFGSLLNHSCDPNIYVINSDNRCAYVVRRPIKANEQLFITYGSNICSFMSCISKRRKYLKEQYDFICQCCACINDKLYCEKLVKSLAMSVIQSEGHAEMPLSRPKPKSYGEAVKELKENCKYIEDHTDNIFTCMNYMLMDRNIELLYFLAKIETFPNFNLM